MPQETTATKKQERTFFGHPIGLSTLFFTEMWERFSYYGMRAFLTLYIAAEVSKGGLGESKATAGIIYGLYGALVYLVSLPGGWIADRFIGQRKAVLIGGVIIMMGHITLAMPGRASFIPGLGLIVVGTGFLKPNISTIVGQLYSKEDPRRDAGYTIYYMGINIGALIAPLVCGYLAQSDGFRAILQQRGIDPNSSWHFGFGAAAVGMGIGLIQYFFGWKHMGKAGLRPIQPEKSDKGSALLSPGPLAVTAGATAIIVGFAVWHLTGAGVSKGTIANCFGVGLITISVAVFMILHKWAARDEDERRRVRAMMVLFIGCLSFFALFEQAGSTLNFFAEEKTHNAIFGYNFPASWWQSINPVYVILLAPVFAWLWVKLAAAKREPSAVAKFAAGMVLIAVSFAVLLPAVLGPIAAGGKAGPWSLLALYFFSTCGEMCVSPVGLSTMNKLAPERLAGFVMGIWFLATSIGYYLAGRAEHVVGEFAKGLKIGPTPDSPAGLFYLLIGFSLIVAALLYVLAGPVKRMLSAEIKSATT
jgi:POT family proton-dependent oligopeptide transporter